MKAKTLTYTLLVSLILTLMGIGVVKFSRGTATTNPSSETSGIQKLPSLKKASKGTPGVQRILKRQIAAEEANEAATKDLGN